MKKIKIHQVKSNKNKKGLVPYCVTTLLQSRDSEPDSLGSYKEKGSSSTSPSPNAVLNRIACEGVCIFLFLYLFTYPVLPTHFPLKTKK